MKIGVNLWFLTLIIAIINVSFTKSSGYYQQSKASFSY